MSGRVGCEQGDGEDAGFVIASTRRAHRSTCVLSVGHRVERRAGIVLLPAARAHQVLRAIVVCRGVVVMHSDAAAPRTPSGCRMRIVHWASPPEANALFAPRVKATNDGTLLRPMSAVQAMGPSLAYGGAGFRAGATVTRPPHPSGCARVVSASVRCAREEARGVTAQEACHHEGGNSGGAAEPHSGRPLTGLRTSDPPSPPCDGHLAMRLGISHGTAEPMQRGLRVAGGLGPTASEGGGQPMRL